MSEARNYSADDLMDLAECKQSEDVHLGSAGEFGGLVMPRDYTQGQLISPNHARKLAAQLLREADLYETIFYQGYQEGQKSLQPQVDMLKRTLGFVHMQISNQMGVICGGTGWTSMVEQVKRALGIVEEEEPA